MYYIKELDIYVNKIEDLRDKISDDLYIAIENLMNKEIKDNNEPIETLKEEMEVYELEVESLRHKLDDITLSSNEIEHDIDKLTDYIINTKRIDRRRIESELIHIYNNIRNIHNISINY